MKNELIVIFLFIISIPSYSLSQESNNWFKDSLFLPQIGEQYKSKKICTKKVKEIREFKKDRYHKVCSKFIIENKRYRGSSNIDSLIGYIELKYDTLIHHSSNLKELSFSGIKNDSIIYDKKSEYYNLTLKRNTNTLNCIILYSTNCIYVSSKYFTFSIIGGKYDPAPSQVFNNILNPEERESIIDVEIKGVGALYEERWILPPQH
ncbi:hypothetical protein [Salibacter halophilus]|uniref:Uncharacterized protein n=1 Tax=Salibacter halophilus TaxID=1803916 RepID=A0A6N6M821_9FLAO|nr:hypothetical protein [Salibacter halophilus]KAB1064901.1 hypothetical protein F3059_05985 [Salibacter halophilus]